MCCTQDQLLLIKAGHNEKGGMGRPLQNPQRSKACEAAGCSCIVVKDLDKESQAKYVIRHKMNKSKPSPQIYTRMAAALSFPFIWSWWFMHF